MQVGDTLVWDRTFTEEDIRLFGELAHDSDLLYAAPDAQGRRMIRGLLTALVPTRIGVDWNFLAQTMHFNFVRPVFVGDTIHYTVAITELEQVGLQTRLSATMPAQNQKGKAVMTGYTTGIIREPRQYDHIGLH